MLYRRSKRKNAHWWVRFEVKGVEVRQSSGTDSKERAEAFEQSLREAIWDEQNLGIEVHTWDEAIARWCREKAHKRSLKRDRQAFAAIGLSGELTSELVPGYSECGARERAAYRSIANECVKWGWLDKAPKVEMPHEEKHEPRWITKAQFGKLCKELPPHAAALARFGAATGLRQRNIFRLRWADVDLRAKRLQLASKDVKTNKSIAVPLNADALAVLRGQQGKHEVFAFTDDQERAPVGSIKTTWLKAVKRAGLEGFRFHDLRHTWAAWHVLAGTPPIILKELGGWSSLAMVERYGHLNPGHLAAWANNSRVRHETKKHIHDSGRGPHHVGPKARTKTGTRRKAKKRKSL